MTDSKSPKMLDLRFLTGCCPRKTVRDAQPRPTRKFHSDSYAKNCPRPCQLRKAAFKPPFRYDKTIWQFELNGAHLNMGFIFEMLGKF